MSQKICKECGAEYTAKKAHSKFCSTKCRKDYNNRRAVRGAQLYDVFMAIRYDREAATKYGLDRTFISRMGEMFNEEDKGSRVRTVSPTAALAKLRKNWDAK